MGYAPRVLIISNRQDTHVPVVTRHLDRFEAPYFIFNTEEFGAQVLGTFSLAVQNSMILRSANVEVPIDDLRSVWYRRPKPPLLSNLEPEAARNFAQSEQKAFLDGLLACLDCAWLSKPSSIRNAGHKILQLRVAQHLGFHIPPTLVSQSPREIREFRAAVGKPLAAKLVAKGPPVAPTVEEQYVVFTQLLDDTDLDDEKTLAACVTMYQPYVAKKFELRVTVVGDEVFACRIDSQASEQTQIDWRRYDLDNTPHSTYLLDSDTRKKCLELVKYFGLAFGAIDLIVTPQDELVFLEINPNGQWGWIEELTGMPISEAVARYLCEA